MTIQYKLQIQIIHWVECKSTVDNKVLIQYTYLVYMQTEVIPLRIDKATLSKLDKMVKSGMFKSRNEAFNIAIKAGIKNFDFWTDIINVSDSYDEDYDKEVSLRLSNALNKFLLDRDRY